MPCGLQLEELVVVVWLAYWGSVGYIFATRDKRSSPVQWSFHIINIVLISVPVHWHSKAHLYPTISATSKVIINMEVKLCVDSMKLESPSTEYSSGSESSPCKTTKPARVNHHQLPKIPKYKTEEIRRIHSKRKIFPGPGVIEEELDSLDSVLTNPSLLPLTVVPTYASNLSKLSRQGSIRWVKGLSWVCDPPLQKMCPPWTCWPKIVTYTTIYNNKQLSPQTRRELPSLSAPPQIARILQV